MLAFGKGVSDAGRLSLREIEHVYNSYLRPMRPMDAAAYQRGLEYSLNFGNESDWQDMKRDFMDAWESGAITREGTALRKSGRRLRESENAHLNRAGGADQTQS